MTLLKNFDSDSISLFGIIGAVLGFFIGIIIAKMMNNGVLARLLVGAGVALACYFVAAKISDA